MPPQAIEQRSEFIEMVGLMVQTFGLRRISGRILGLLVFDGAVLSAQDMAEVLETSKGSVSTGLQELQAKSVIHKISHSGDRTTFYELLDHPYAELLTQSGARARKSASAILETLDVVEAEDRERNYRLAQFAQFYVRIADAMEDAGKRILATRCL